MPENLLVASNLFSGGHVTGYSRHFEKIIVPETCVGWLPSK